MKHTHHKYTSLLALILASCSTYAADHYTVTDLGSLGDAVSASAINNNGIAAGYAVDLLYRYHGLISDGTTITPLTPTMSMTAQGQAMGINSFDQTVLASYMLGQLNTTTLLYLGNPPLMMPMMLGDFMPCAINDSAQVVGSQFITDPSGFKYEQACKWQMGSLISLNPLNGSHTSIAKAINEMGWAVGSATSASSLKPTATLWIGTNPSNLGTLPSGTWSQANAINDFNQVVGISQITSGFTHAFLYNLNASGVIVSRIDLGELGGGYSSAHAINNAGEVVGTSDNLAFIYTNGVMRDLNTLIGPSSPWNLASANAINEDGQIVGVGSLGGDPFRAFLLTPAASCIADLNNDGVLNFFDVSALLTAFTNQDPLADLNNDGIYNFFDISAFITAYAQGCP